MTEGYISTLWELWSKRIIEPAHVIKALGVYGYELDALTNEGITASTNTERYSYKHGVRE